MEITIGDKPLKELKADELLQLVIIEGCCPAIIYEDKRIWNEPVIKDFNNTMFSDTHYLDYSSYRISDNLQSSDYTFFFNYRNFSFHYTVDYDNNKDQPSSGKRLSIRSIKYLIEKGYDVPIY